MEKSKKKLNFTPPKTLHTQSFTNTPHKATCAAVLTGVLRQMDESHFKHYMSHFETAFDLIDFLMEILMIFEDLVTRSVFSVDWSEMIMLQNWWVGGIGVYDCL